MADYESFIEVDELDCSTISAFIRLQAYVRGFLVRRLLKEIRKEYEDIVKDINKDSDVEWPDRFGLPVVKKCSELRKQEKNQTNVCPKSVVQFEQEDNRTPLAHFGKNGFVSNDQVQADSDIVQSRREMSRNCVGAVHDNECNNNVDRNKDDGGNCRNDTGSSHLGIGSQRGDLDFGQDTKVVTMSDQGIQIDLEANLSANAEGPEKANDGLVSKQIQVDQSEIALICDSANPRSNSNSFTCEEVKHSYNEVGFSNINENRKSPPSGVTDTERDQTDSKCGADGFLSSNNSDAGEKGSKTCVADDEVVSELEPIEKKQIIPTSPPVSPIFPCKNDNDTTSMKCIDENREGSNDSRSIVFSNVDVLQASLEPDDVSRAKGFHPNIPTARNDLKERSSPTTTTTTPDLPSDKSSLLEMKKTMTMELLWIQQAINSRKHYLRLKQNLAS